MEQKNIVVLDEKGSVWFDFLEEYFEETEAKILWCYDASQAGQCLSKFNPHVIFVRDLFSGNPTFLQKLNAYQQIRPEFRAFQLGNSAGSKKNGFRFNQVFHDPEAVTFFQRELPQHLPLPERIDLLTIDDEEGIGDVIKDFMEGRTRPLFTVRHASDGQSGLKAIKEKKPDVLILDVKMPKMGGCDVFRYLKQHEIHIPTIMFFDVISGEEIAEIRSIGKAAIVEKGSAQSTMSDMLSLIQKVLYFSA